MEEILMKKMPILFISLVAILVQGCGTPQVVKSLSAEQLNAQKISRESFGTYFGIIEQVINNQVVAFKAEEDRDFQKEISIYMEKYSNAVKKEGADQNALLAELFTQIIMAREKTNNEKKKYENFLLDLKKKHMAILEMIDKMVIAQETLNSYIQLKKADEAVGNAVISALGTNQDKVRRSVDEIKNTSRIQQGAK